MLIKNPTSEEHGVIHYSDVGDYKTQREKLDFAAEAVAVEPEWTILQPDMHGDWLNQSVERHARRCDFCPRRQDREARARGVCPVTLLDDFLTEHWDHETLCSGFDCPSCVGNPMDEYFAEDDGWCPPWSHVTEPEELEIPF